MRLALGMAHDAFNFWVAALPYDDEVVALVNKVRCGLMNFFDVRARCIDHTEPARLSIFNDLRDYAV